MHLEILDDKRRKMISQLTFLNKYGFYLAGGTALALHLGHRTSVDFDFYTPKSFNPDDVIADFEKISGYPNLWTWGYEDNSLQKRALDSGINIDRTQFYKVGCKEIIQFLDDVYKKVNRDEFNRYTEKKSDGLHTIQELDYVIDECNQMIKISNFKIPYANNPEKNTLYDIRSEDRRPFTYNKKGRFNSSMRMAF